MKIGNQLERSQDIATKVALLYQKRLQIARDHFAEQLQAAHVGSAVATKLASPAALAGLGSDVYPYAVDAAQRSVLFWDTMRQRGNNFIDHTTKGFPPVLHFKYETLIDGRKLARPVNYALLRIVPPDGIVVDPKRRPYVIIDPRGGHGPGIGGFKDDSQVGVALREGHPVYFVIFFRDPEPGQTVLDVCEVEKLFVRKVRELHPDSPKPAIVGNCQAGWAAMMLAASDPDDTGPIVINGAPMSYWSGAWREGAGDNPMRYAGGILGGTWLASLSADLGDGVFDGAYLVENFEYLNPANTWWNKYYNVWANIDTEPARFLEFERWWGAYYLLNREEIEWITRNLFIGNKLWNGETKGADGHAFDLRAIKSPIVLFASLGDNITPPQQAFNWVADVYKSTEEIKARGQVIVGLMHENVGHLGVFVSGQVARKEYAGIVSVLKSIELLQPGLYGMDIKERKEGGAVAYDVEFREFTLEEVAARLNRFHREDEEPFEAVAEVSDFNQHAYELFLQPAVQATSNGVGAKMMREFHPLRFQRWSFSDLNPWLGWLAPAAGVVKSNRQPVNAKNVLLDLEKAGSAAITASLDLYRAVRDATTEALFFLTYGSVFSMYIADKRTAEQQADAQVTDAPELPYVKDALAAIERGGYAEALARIICLLKPDGEPLQLAKLQLGQELIADYGDLLPTLPPDEWRRLRGEQEIIVRYAPEKALATLPKLVGEGADRRRLTTLVQRLLADERVQRTPPPAQVSAKMRQIAATLEAAAASRKPRARGRESAGERTEAAMK